MNQKRKGLHPLAWVGIGCAGLVVIALIIVMSVCVFVGSKFKDVADDPAAMAEYIIKLNPDLEVVESDLDAGTITVRDLRTNKTVTVDFQDIKDGRLVFESDEGTMSIDANSDKGSVSITSDGASTVIGSEAAGTQVPTWIPIMDGASDIQVGFHQTSSEGSSGTFSIDFGAGMEEIKVWYEQRLKDEGYEVRTQSAGTSDGSFVSITGENQALKRMMTLTLIESDGKTQSTVNYSEGS